MTKSKYQKNLEWDDMSFGEARQHIGKKMTEKSHKIKSDYKRKPKYTNWDITDNDDE
jgi:phosphoserine aminotransferase